jgi:hypothetical protein
VTTDRLAVRDLLERRLGSPAASPPPMNKKDIVVSAGFICRDERN